MKTALVVDDHSFIRAAVRNLLSREGFNELHEASNGIEAIKVARDKKPDIIVLDIVMPSLDGLEVVRRLVDERVEAKFLFLTALPAAVYVPRCKNVGADGYISKDDEAASLLKAIDMLMTGYTFFPRLDGAVLKNGGGAPSELALISQLSNRELVVMQKLSQGYSNKEISEDLFLSNKTVSSYKTRLLSKLQLSSVVALAEFSRRNGII